MKFYPEGINPSLTADFKTADEIKDAIKSGEIYEANVLRCDSAHNLILDLGAFKGIIPRAEGAVGIIEGDIRDIALISRVNKRVCFRVKGFHNENGSLVPVLSRRSVQLEALEKYVNPLKTGDIIRARVTRLEKFGAFIDIGAGINSLIPIDMLSVSRISSPAERISEGQLINVVLRRRDPEKLTFSLKELLGTWEENARFFAPGETVTGIVRSIEPYGIFVELTPNLAGLADYTEGLEKGQRVSVFIKSVMKSRMKIKLAVVEAFSAPESPEPLNYFISAAHIDEWRYSPEGADRLIYTSFA